MTEQLPNWLGFAGVIAYMVAVFWGVRKAARAMPWDEKKLFLYLLAFGATMALVVANKLLPDWLLFAGFLGVIASFFAIVFA